MQALKVNSSDSGATTWLRSQIKFVTFDIQYIGSKKKEKGMLTSGTAIVLGWPWNTLQVAESVQTEIQSNPNTAPPSLSTLESLCTEIP
jgi:hypothetical protein